MAGKAVFLPAQMRSSYGVGSRGGAPIGRGRNENMQGFSISRATFERIEQFIADSHHSQQKAQQGVDLLVRAMVLVIKGLAQSKSAGAVASQQRSNPALAGRIPVQRITGAYFAGWKHRKVGHAHWIVYNESKEAYLIEHGIYQRVRRPILKMSMIGMLRFIQTTRTGDRFADWVIAPRRTEGGKFASFNARLAGTQSLGGMAGPQGRLPG